MKKKKKLYKVKLYGPPFSLTTKCHEILQPRDMGLELLDDSEICQVFQDTCQISEQWDQFNIQSICISSVHVWAVIVNLHKTQTQSGVYTKYPQVLVQWLLANLTQRLSWCFKRYCVRSCSVTTRRNELFWCYGIPVFLHSNSARHSGGHYLSYKTGTLII